MAISTEQRVDYLFKKLGFTLSKTGFGTEKSPSNESIPSPLIIPGGIIWSESGPDKIPTTPPSSDTQYVKVFGNASALQMTMDPTSVSRRTFIARQTPGITTSTILGDWIDKQFGNLYGVKIFANNPDGSGGTTTLLDPNGSGSDDTWFFDYSSGVLNFNGPSIPTAVLTNNVFIVGWRYIGAKGVLSEGGQSQTSLSIANLNVSGITTIGVGNTGVVINAGIITSISGLTTVTFVGNLTGTASTASFATTAFSLNGFDFNTTTVGSAKTATDVIGGIGSISRLSVSGITTIGAGNTGVVINAGIITSISGFTTVTFVGNLTGTASTAGFAQTAFNLQGFDFNTTTVGSAKTATDVIGGIGSISRLSVSGITTIGAGNTGVVINAGIITSISGLTTVTFVGNLTGTASTASFATTAFSLNGFDFNTTTVGSAKTATDVIGGIGSISRLSVSGITTIGAGNTGIVLNGNTGVVTSISGLTTVTYFGDGSKLTGIRGVTVEFQPQTAQTLFPTLAANSGVSSIGIATTGSTAFSYIPSSGNLGIGTTIPSSKLTVDGNVLVSGITTIGAGNTGVVINAGIITSISGFTTVTFVGNLTGTASTASFATTSFTLNGRTESQFNVAFAQTAGISTNVIGGIGSITQLSVSGVTTSGEFIGGGSDLRNLQGTHLVSYSSYSESSNSSTSISGISTYSKVGIITGSNAIEINENFGKSVVASADGKTIIIGSPNDELSGFDNTGLVYVFDRVGNSFNEVGILTGINAINDADNFGISLATSADGKTIIVGASSDENAGSNTGLVYVFDRVGNSFSQVGILTGSNAGSNDLFGTSVATSADGKTIVVGSSADETTINDTGLVYVFDRVGNSFNQVGILTGSNTGSIVDGGDNFGISVATSADGKTIVVGSSADEISPAENTGLVYVFDRVGNSFNRVGILTGSNAITGGDLFGISVATSADGKTIVVGASFDETSVSDSGIAYVFDRTVDSFNQVAILTGSFPNGNDRYGNCVGISADGKKIVVGAVEDETVIGNFQSGLTYVYNRIGNSFNQVGILTGSNIPGTQFGSYVATSADGKSIIVGSQQGNSSIDNTGCAFVFDEVRQTYLHSNPQGNIGIGTSNPTSKLQVLGGDIRVGINTSQGVILTSPDGTKYRLIVANGGALSTVLVP